MEKYYEVLGISAEASEEEIRQAFASKKKLFQQDLLSRDHDVQRKATENISRLTEAYSAILKANNFTLAPIRNAAKTTENKKPTERKSIRTNTSKAYVSKGSEPDLADTAQKPQKSADSTENLKSEVKAGKKLPEAKISRFRNTRGNSHVSGKREYIEDGNPKEMAIAALLALSVSAVILFLVDWDDLFKIDPKNNNLKQASIQQMNPMFGKQEGYDKDDIAELNKRLGNMLQKSLGNVDKERIYKTVKKSVNSADNSYRYKSNKYNSSENNYNVQLYVNKMERYNSAITGLAQDINRRIMSDGDLRRSRDLYDSSKNLFYNIANTSADFRDSRGSTDRERQLQYLFELEKDRARGLMDGLSSGIEGKEYMPYFKQGTDASYKFDDAEKSFRNLR